MKKQDIYERFIEKEFKNYDSPAKAGEQHPDEGEV